MADFPSNESWQITTEGVIYMVKENDQIVFKQLNIKSQTVTDLAKIKQPVRLPFAVSKDGSKIFAIADVADESAIFQIPFTVE